MSLELIVSLKEPTALTRREAFEALLDLVERAPGFEPATYDVNMYGTPRAWSRDRVRVDAQTQRTQVLRVDGVGGEALAMLALGKHDEPATLAIRWSKGDAASPPELLERFRPWLELAYGGGAASALRICRVLASQGEAGLRGVRMIAWPAGQGPAGVERASEGRGWWAWLASTSSSTDEAMVAAWLSS